MGSPSFSLVTYERDGAVVARFAGEYELQSAPAVADRLAEIEAGEPDLIVLDLSGLSFVDSTALGQLVGVVKRAQGRRRVIAVRPRDPVRRVFEVTLLDRAFEMVDHVDEALSRLG